MQPTGQLPGKDAKPKQLPPGDDIAIGNITGELRQTGIGVFTQIIAVKGSAVISFPPPATGSYLAPFSAHFAMDADFVGSGGWSLGNTDVNDVPIRSGN